MSYGATANSAEVIEIDFIEEICQDELDDFLEFVNEFGSLDAFAQEKPFHSSPIDESFGSQNDNIWDCEFVNEEQEEKLYKELCEKWNKLSSVFEKRTGLQLDVGYHNREDEGSLYDEVSEVYWRVYGVYVLSDAGKKYKDKWKTLGWTVSG